MDFVGVARPLTGAGFTAVQTSLQIDAAALWAILTVETKGMGFSADRRPQILFERHVFHKRTKGRFAGLAPNVSSAVSGGYLGGAAEYRRLAVAVGLDARAALESTSWGLGQVMGFHATALAYASVEDMVAKFRESEDEQLDGTRRFLANNDALRVALSKRQWARVAFFYNGRNYVKNAYDQKLEQSYDLYVTRGLPDIDVRAAQVRLVYLGFDVRGADGIAGRTTRAATLAFQKGRGLTPSGEFDTATLEALRTAAGV